MPPARKAAAPAKKAASPAKRAAVPPKKALSARAPPQATFTMKQIAAELAESHDLPKKKAEAILSDLVTATARHLKKGDKIRLTGLGMRPPFGPDDTPAVGRGHPVTCSCTKTVQMLLPYRRVSRPHPQ